MQNQTPNMENMSSGEKSKSWVYVVVAVIAILVFCWFFFGERIKTYDFNNQSLLPSEQSQNTSPDSLTSINGDLQSIDLGDLNVEFQAVDKDINSL